MFFVPIDFWGLTTAFLASLLFLFFIFERRSELRPGHLLIVLPVAVALVAERDVAFGYSIVVGSAVFLARSMRLEK